MKKLNILKYLLYLIVVPLMIALGIILFKDRNYMLVSIFIVVAIMVPFFISFEKRRNTTRELVVIATMTTISVLSRVIFAPIPNIKPITAIIMITGIAFGAEAGFITGASTALISNIFFGQGPWTPFQMFAFGLIGFLSGIFFYKKDSIKKPNLIIVIVVGVIFGALYSVLLDIWTVISLYDGFSIAKWWAAIISAIPVTIQYCASNLIFLLLLTYPLLNKLNRIKIKYNVFNY